MRQGCWKKETDQWKEIKSIERREDGIKMKGVSQLIGRFSIALRRAGDFFILDFFMMKGGKNNEAEIFFFSL